MAPRLAVYAREVPDAWWGAGRGEVRSLAVQVRACRRRVGLLRGRHGDLDLFVDAADAGGGGGAQQWDVLLDAVAEGLYDGVVIDSLPVAVVGRVQSIELRRLMRSSGCELYVADDPGLGLSDFRGFGFVAAVEALCGSDGDLSACAGADGDVEGSAGDSGLGSDGCPQVAGLVARLGRVVGLFVDAADDPRWSAELMLRRRAIEAELRRLRLVAMRRCAGMDEA